MKLPAIKANNQFAATCLRVGLAFVFLYASIAGLRNPAAWEPFLPALLTDHISPDLLLKFFDLLQLVIVVWLISGWQVRYAAALSALMLAGITITNLAA